MDGVVLSSMHTKKLKNYYLDGLERECLSLNKLNYQFQHFIEDLTNDDKSIWKKQNEIIGS